jgi:tRNA A-37 threonylcarbamoyl transferase component Bud32
MARGAELRAWGARLHTAAGARERARDARPNSRPCDGAGDPGGLASTSRRAGSALREGCRPTYIRRALSPPLHRQVRRMVAFSPCSVRRCPRRMTCDNCGHENQAGARFCAGCGGPLPSGEADATYPLIGQIVGGRYHIVGLVGEGGMGVVYKAEQRLGSTVRKVAVKTLHADLSRDPAITARFHREVGTIAQLEHPNTVKVYDFGSTDDGTLYIAMEFLDGKPLNRVIQSEGALEPRRVGNLLRQIAGSLDEAHRQGIVHRDLKPENVILIERAGEKDVVKLVDFGIAARTESADRAKEQKLTQQGMVLGTPPYMSPEQFTGKALDARSDVYSLGIMTYEMLTGQLPFQADTPWQWATHHMTSQPRSFDELPGGSRLPEGVRRAVLKSLSKEPGERQSGAGQFQSEFLAGLSGTGTVPPRPVAAGGKTEAMPETAVPLGIAATQAMPEASPLAGHKVAIPTPPGAVALPPGPSREQSGGGRGPIYWLGGAATLLGIAVVAVAVSSRRSGPDATPIDLQPAAEHPAGSSDVTANSGNGPEPTTVEPESPAPSEDRDNGKPSSSTSKPANTTRPASTRSPAPSPPARPAATPANPPPPSPAQLPAGAPAALPTVPANVPPIATPPAGADACAACMKAANTGAAAAAYAQCTNDAMKQSCRNRIGPIAVRDVTFAANNGKCVDARAILSAAQQMGVDPRRLAKAEAAAAGCK